MTLREALKMAGFTLDQSETNDVLDPDRRIVFRGCEADVWQWLHELADIQRDEEVVVVALEGCDDPR